MMTNTDTQIKPELIAEIGQFKYFRNGAGEDSVEGPEAYLHAQGSPLLAQIAAGEDAIFNLTCGQSPGLDDRPRYPRPPAAKVSRLARWPDAQTANGGWDAQAWHRAG